MKKIVTLFLSVLMLLGCCGAALAEKQPVGTEYYDNPLVDGNISCGTELDTAWFNRPSSAYDHELTKLSFVLTAAAFKKHPSTLEETDDHLKAFFEAAGFGTYEAYDYHITPTKDTIANGFAARELSDEKGVFVLVAVPVCGQGYGDEWVSNLTVGNTADHTGFSDAASKVYDRLTTYLDTHFPGKRIKLWITGYSRAAAVSNELAHMALTSGWFEEDNVFCYCFATPNNTRNPVAHPQIFNIINGFDAVPTLPFADWGYGKHGVMLYLPTPSTTIDFDEKEQKANAVYRAATGIPDGRVMLVERNMLLDEILYMIYCVFPFSENYANGYQQALSAAWLAPGAVTDKLSAFIDATYELELELDLSKEGRDEVDTMSRLLLNYLANAMRNKEENPVWSTVLTSGKRLLHEHLPATYQSWLFSGIPAEELYNNSEKFTRISYNRGPELRVVHVDAKTGKETVLHDTAAGLKMTAYAETSESVYLDLPAGEKFVLTLTFNEDATNRIYSSTMDVSDTDGIFKCTPRMTMYAGETVTMRVNEDPLAFNGVRVLLNGRVPVRHVLTELTEDYGIENAELTTVRPVDELKYEMFTYLPVLGALLIILLAALGTLIIRLVKRRKDDGLPCGKKMKIALIVIAVLWIVGAVYTLLMIPRLRSESNSVTTKLFTRLGELYDVTGLLTVCITAFFLFVNAGVSLGSIRRRRSRRWLVFLSVMNLVSGIVIIVFVGLEQIEPALFIFYPALPVAALIAAILAQKADKRERMRLARVNALRKNG